MTAHEEQAGRRPPPFVMHVVGDVAPNGEAIGLQIERSEQVPVDLCLRTQDVEISRQHASELGLRGTPPTGPRRDQRPAD